MTADDDRRFRKLRARMVGRQLRRRGITDPRVLRTLATVPRQAFLPADVAAAAYEDRPIPIGHGQTISQPFVVAYMTAALELAGTERVLEVGTGCGYQTAVLAELAGRVLTVEILPELAARARATLAGLGYRNIDLRTGNGYLGWAEQGPFDRILVTAAPDRVPAPLLDQLAPGGRLVLPLGSADQRVVAIDRTAGGFDERALIPVRFVPMTGTPDSPEEKP